MNYSQHPGLPWSWQRRRRTIRAFPWGLDCLILYGKLWSLTCWSSLKKYLCSSECVGGNSWNSCNHTSGANNNTNGTSGANKSWLASKPQFLWRSSIWKVSKLQKHLLSVTPPPFPQLTKSICKHVGPFSPWNVILWYSRRIEVYCDVAEKKKFKKTFDMGRLPLPASTLLCYISLLSGLWNIAHGGNPL